MCRQVTGVRDLDCGGPVCSSWKTVYGLMSSLSLPRSRQGSPGRRPGRRLGGRTGRGLPRGRRDAAVRAGRLRPGRLRRDRLPPERRPRLRCRKGPAGHPVRTVRSPPSAGSLAGENAPDTEGQVVIDPDGVLVITHCDKEDAAATWKKTHGHHPLTACVDHGPDATGEPVAALPGPGFAGSITAADHIAAVQLILAQLPEHYWRGHQTLIRTDSASGTHVFVSWLARRGQQLSHPVGMVITEAIHDHVPKAPASSWTPTVRDPRTGP